MRHRPHLLAVAALALLGLAGCASSAAVAAPGSPATGPAGPALPAPTVTASVAEGAVLELGTPLTVTAAGGDLGPVELVSADGAQLPVEAPAGLAWTGPTTLPPVTAFTLTATATGADGQTTRLRRTFTTGAPERELTVDVTPWGDQTVGIGHPIVVRLSHKVTGPVERAAVERALVVTASRPLGEAGWSWTGDRELQYRPRDFWPAHTRVTVAVNLAGVHAGDGLWGVRSREVRFAIGRAQTITIDDATHRATVERDGQVVRTMPVSLGKPGRSTTTRSGVKVVMDRHTSYRMRSSTLGVEVGPDAYDQVVPYAMRITNSGEFLHGAPWNGNIGRRNTSHGCTNLRVADAEWLYHHVLVGDPVITHGTGRAMEAGNGLGGVWNVPWEAWQQRSAAAITAAQPPSR